jgi:hypothetical protein
VTNRDDGARWAPIDERAQRAEDGSLGNPDRQPKAAEN